MSDHEIICPHCQHVLRSNQPIHLGARGKCPGCGVWLLVTQNGIFMAADPGSGTLTATPPPPAAAPAAAPPASADPFADLLSEAPAEPVPTPLTGKRPARRKRMPRGVMIALAIGLPVLIGGGVLAGLIYWPTAKKPGNALAQAQRPAPSAKLENEEPPPRSARKAEPKPARLPEKELTLPTHTAPETTKLSAPFDDWHQDPEEAKRVAAMEGKDLFILFDGSDWCGWSIRLAHEVLFQKEFLEEARRRYVLVVIDFPRSANAKAKVQDAERNRRLAREYGVQGYPSIVLADAQGRPYAFTGYQQGGSQGWLQRLTKLQQTRTRRDQLLGGIEKAEGVAKLKAVQGVLDFLMDEGLLSFYLPLLTDWGKLARLHDPKNEQAFLEMFFELEWSLELRKVEREDEQSISKVVAVLDDWMKQHTFKDGDRAARLHLVAAALLAAVDKDDDAELYAEAGLAFKPKNKDLNERLNRVRSALSGCLGTGFVVGPDGYILTNHHVVEDRKQVRIRVAGLEDAITGEVVASDPERDLALVKLAMDPGATAKPLPVASSRQVTRGEKVGVLGFGLGDAIGSGLKLTTGVVSATPERGNNQMLVLDCRVNPGNSGGPLCDASGCVTGMVTAKSFSGDGIDSYGMALPAQDLATFLKKHVPNYQPPAAPTKKLEWEEVDRLVSPSVVMILKARKAGH